jgi:hypothetical protein
MTVAAYPEKRNFVVTNNNAAPAQTATWGTPIGQPLAVGERWTELSPEAAQRLQDLASDTAPATIRGTPRLVPLSETAAAVR